MIVVALSSCLPTFMFHDEILGLLEVGICLYFGGRTLQMFSKPLRKQTYSILKGANISNQNSIFLISHTCYPPCSPFLHFAHVMCLHYFVN